MAVVIHDYLTFSKYDICRERFVLQLQDRASISRTTGFTVVSSLGNPTLVVLITVLQAPKVFPQFYLMVLFFVFSHIRPGPADIEHYLRI